MLIYFCFRICPTNERLHTQIGNNYPSHLKTTIAHFSSLQKLFPTNQKLPKKTDYGSQLCHQLKLQGILETDDKKYFKITVV
jgi:hypothetical protein